ncbi:MAG: ATP-binding protein [Aliidongia sp.]
MINDLDALPEYRDNPFIAGLPPLLSAPESWQALADPPIHREEERQYAPHLRAHCILRLTRYFEPLTQHLQLQEALSTTLRQGYISRNPLTTDYIHRLQDGYDRVVQRDLTAGRHRVRSTATSFALIGCSGIGKSTAIERLLELYPQIIAHEAPFSLQQIVWLKLDCPYLGSPKQLCISFFKAVDDLLGTNYLAKHGDTRISIDAMMVQMAHVANLHAVGTLIIDEIQHLRQAKSTGAEAERPWRHCTLRRYSSVAGSCPAGLQRCAGAPGVWPLARSRRCTDGRCGNRSDSRCPGQLRPGT